MGTRSGDIDPAIVKYIAEKENINVAKVDEILNKKSGVLGMSGVSSDFRDIEDAAEKGNVRAKLALDVFVHKVKKYIGAYAAVMNGVDAIIFTAGLGENSGYIRSEVCKDMSFLGIELDEAKNNVRGKETDLSKAGAKVKILLVPTNEELMIARDTKKIISK